MRYGSTTLQTLYSSSCSRWWCVEMAANLRSSHLARVTGIMRVVRRLTCQVRWSDRRKSFMSEGNKALARSWADIWNQGNLDLVDEIYAPDYVNHDLTMPEDVRGVEDVREFYRRYLSALDRKSVV